MRGDMAHRIGLNPRLAEGHGEGLGVGSGDAIDKDAQRGLQQLDGGRRALVDGGVE